MIRNTYSAFIRLSLLCTAAFLGGCSQMLLFDPKGPIGDTERFVIIVVLCAHADRRHSRLYHGHMVSAEIQCFQYQSDL